MLSMPAILSLLLYRAGLGCIDSAPESGQEQSVRESAPMGALTNRLSQSTSPYLRQHADQPVDWFPWGDEAFERARALDRLVFLSVGYSTCHWCHVMAHESFEDPEVAAFLNARFVSVKVDREERPDVDQVYMEALRALNRGQGGWPMTLVLTPAGEPVFAATYLPPRDGERGRALGLVSVLERVHQAWLADRGSVVARGADITAFLASRAAPKAPAGVPEPGVVDAAVDTLLARVDPMHGGLGVAPKFPRFVALDLLLSRPRAQEAVVNALRAMARGGVYDQLGGGLHRYAVDRAWRVPHFEKMLYDNAQLIGTATAAWQVAEDPGARRELEALVRRTVAWMDREMSVAGHGFASALDADSPTGSGEFQEGAFYTWTPREVEAALGPVEAAEAQERWGITEAGNLEGRSVLWQASGAPHEADDVVERARRALVAARSARPAPARDDKVITAWNAYAISALARASVLLGEPAWADRAMRAWNHVIQRRGQAGIQRLDGVPGTLEDQAAMAVAALDLFEATLDPSLLAHARQWLADVEAHYRSPEGAWFRTPEAAEALIVRPRDQHEGAEPSGTALALHALLRLAHLTDDPGLLAIADRALRASSAHIAADPTRMPLVTLAVARRHAPAQEIVLVWPDGAAADAEPLCAVVRQWPTPFAERVVAESSVARGAAVAVPWLEGKVPRRGRPTAYVCEAGVCQAPVHDPSALTALLTASARTRATAGASGE